VSKGRFYKGRSRSERVNNPGFNNREFWDHRYLTNFDLGSGIGSRGKNLSHKRRILLDFLQRNEFNSILDIGCGDCQTVADINFLRKQYRGIDISVIAIEHNRRRFPERTFSCVDVLQAEHLDDLKSDITVCFEVLIHQHKLDDYHRFVRNLLYLTARSGILSGYILDPRTVTASEIIAWHEPVTETLQWAGARNVAVEAFSLETDVLAFVSFEA
jgi:SAM-dependent methyltransferase